MCRWYINYIFLLCPFSYTLFPIPFPLSWKRLEFARWSWDWAIFTGVSISFCEAVEASFTFCFIVVVIMLALIRRLMLLIWSHGCIFGLISHWDRCCEGWVNFCLCCYKLAIKTNRKRTRYNTLYLFKTLTL